MVQDRRATLSTGRPMWYWGGDVIVFVTPVGQQVPFHYHWDAGGFAVPGFTEYLQHRDSETPPSWTSPPGSPPAPPTPPTPLQPQPPQQ